VCPIAAQELKLKMKSRQAVQQAAGNKDADFHKLDEVKTICRGINQEAID